MRENSAVHPGLPIRKLLETGRIQSEYNQAAVLDKLLTGLPEVVKALAAPLANVDKITIVSTGNGDTAGLNKITGDITKMAAQVPALFETLSGMPLGELLGKVRQIGDKAPKPEEKQ